MNVSLKYIVFFTFVCLSSSIFYSSFFQWTSTLLEMGVRRVEIPIRRITHTSLARSWVSTGFGLQSSIPMKNFYTVMYTGKIGLGSPVQWFDVVFDTGSADLWIFSSKTGQTKVNYLHYYDNSASSTYLADSRSWKIQYGQGACSGFLSSDIVTLGGYTARQTFAETTLFTSNFQNEDEPMDGIMGMAMQAAASDRAPTVVETLHKNGSISTRMFSFVLSRSLFDNGGSYLILGPPDSSRYINGITWNKVIPNAGMWYIYLDAVSSDDTLLGMCTGGASTPCVALMDTGTSFIGVPGSRWPTILKQIQANRPDCKEQGNLGVICSTHGVQGLPKLSFRFSGRDFELLPEDYLLQYDSGPSRLAMMSLGDGPTDYDRWIMGDTFLKSFYTVFDEDNSRIGIANVPRTGWSTWMIIGLVFGAALLIAAAFFLYRYLRQRAALSAQQLPQQQPPAPPAPQPAASGFWGFLNRFRGSSSSAAAARIAPPARPFSFSLANVMGRSTNQQYLLVDDQGEAEAANQQAVALAAPAPAPVAPPVVGNTPGGFAASGYRLAATPNEIAVVSSSTVPAPHSNFHARVEAHEVKQSEPHDVQVQVLSDEELARRLAAEETANLR
eukprot:TRINITY_DN7813_c0_g1_i1.p1 TRINITY_DN7813_c0_g1~~TRINITY_DN7813_c0_g1_i1.p1  ORF type:complete len:639 (+),score=111.31 TRINITY_DN7813_c0_g1_i1:79-1917(+)